jgi:hypothetical protein
MTRRLYIPLATAVRCALALALLLLHAVLAGARQPESLPTPSQCAFVGQTLVPSLAMGVRRIDDDDIDILELHRKPDPGAQIAAEAALFRPYFVAASVTDAAGGTWHLLQEGYASAAPLGWASGRHLHLLQSRYAYTFANRKRRELAELQDISKESYERLLAQSKGDAEGGKDKVVVKERSGAERWRPSTVLDTVPFVEMLVPREKRDREHPDTTPTFRFGIPVENRLVHMGAVCGGPIDEEKLRQLKGTVLVDKELEMLFVVDETLSMAPFNQVVAKFIRTAGNLAEGRPVPVRVAVCSYTDGKPGTRVNLGEFKMVKGPADVDDLAERVAKLGNDLPPAPYDNPPERMLEGLRDALKNMKFLRGGTPFVAVVGDTGHEPSDAGRQKLVADIAELIKRNGVRTYFMHVGQRQKPDEMLFQKDFKAVQQEAVKLGVPEDHVVYEPAEANNLQAVLEKSRNEVEDERRKLQRQIARMESRTPYTEPGPKLLKALESRGISGDKYEERALQYFVPSQGWLFHPGSQDTSSAKPQLRELFLLAEPERKAVKRLFDDVRDRLSRRDQIDGDAVIATFAAELAGAAGNPALEATVLAAWKTIPNRQRSVGVFLEDMFGLRIKAALPFPPIAYAKERPAAEEEIARMLERIGRLSEAFKDEGEAAFWFDATTLVP